MESFEAPVPKYRNKILQRLSQESIARLKLRPVELAVKKPLEQSQQAIGHLYFIESGVGSMTTTFKDGGQVEVGLFGNESVIGVSAFMGVRRSLNRIYMQMPGGGYACRMDHAEAEFRRGDEFQGLALRYVQMQLTQATQSAGCNAVHEIPQRLARWILLCSDRSGLNEMTLSQEFLAMMLGVRRTTVSATMSSFKERGLLTYTRSNIRLLDRPALEAQACECYAVLRDHLENYLEFDTGFFV